MYGSFFREVFWCIRLLERKFNMNYFVLLFFIEENKIFEVVVSDVKGDK